MRIFFIFLFIIGSYVNASPFNPLYVKIKDNHICVFTNGGYDKAFDDRAFVYLGIVDGINAFHSSYSKIYPNFKMPVVEKNCVTINRMEFNRGLPYDIILETDRAYSRTICIEKNPEESPRLLGVKYELEKGAYCGTNQYDYSSDSLLTKLKNLYYWIISLFN